MLRIHHTRTASLTTRMPDQKFTPHAKLKAIRRELGFRRAVYPKRVARGKMSQAEADRQIAIMEAIDSDYEQQIAEREPSLF